MKTLSIPMYAHPNGETYVIVEGMEQPCELHTIAQNHGHLKLEYFQKVPNNNAIGTLEVNIRPNGWIETDYPAKRVFFKDTKTKYLVTEVIEYFEPYIASGQTVTSRPDEGGNTESYEMYVSISDPLTATVTQSHERVIVSDDIKGITFNEPFVVCEGMRKTYTSYQEVAWFVAPSHRIMSAKRLS
jgi:hypothetical protein